MARNKHEETYFVPETTAYLRKRDFVGRGKLLPISDSTFYRLLRSGKFPEPLRISEKVSMWREDVVHAAIEALGQSNGKGAP